MPLTSATIKQISQLRRKKARQQSGQFVVEGDRMVTEILKQDRYDCIGIYGIAEWVTERMLEHDPRVTVVAPKELARISQLTTPNQALAILRLPETGRGLPSGLERGWSLYLDGIQQPANLGALIRIADWFGFQHVIGGPQTVDLYNPKSIQASMGSFLRINYRTGTLEEITAAHPNLPTFGADLEGKNIYEYEAPKNGMLVIGAEGPGVREQTRPLIQHWLTIPRVPGRKAESLNAAVAAGILAGALVN